MRPFLRLLAQAPGGQVAALFVCMLLHSITDGVGLLLVAPMLGILDAKTTSHRFAATLDNILGAVGLPLSLTAILLVFVGLVTLRSLVQLGQERTNSCLQSHIVDQLRVRCFAALLNVEWRWLATTRRSDHANLLLGDIDRVGVGLHFGISLAASLIAILGYVGVAFLLSPGLTALALVSGSVVFGSLAGHSRQALSLGLDRTRASRLLHNNIQESLSGIRLSKILGNEHRFLQRFRRTTADFRRQQLSFVEKTALSRALFQIVGAALLAVYLYLGLTIWHIPAAEVLTLILIFSRLVPMLMTTQQQLHHWLHSLPALGETETLLAACEAYSEPFPDPDDASDPWIIEKEIRFCGVSLSYEGRARPALSDLSLTLPARCTTAIMGASGSGKSTLADILMGLLPPDSGALLVDGRLVDGSARRRWREAVAYVPQDSFLFHDTVRANLLWGNPTASDDDLCAALEKAAAQFALSLPQGLNTIVGDGGVRLSGGERQRIALARALLKKPTLLILDEATSALDLANEARIRLAIENLHGDLTVVIIGHRLPTLEHADQVVVMEAGRIAAKGSWAEVRAAMNEQPGSADAR